MQTHTRETHTKRTGKNGFTNFSEVSYEITRGSYDRSEIAARKQKVLLAHQSALDPRPHANRPAIAAPCQCLLYFRCSSTHFHTQTGETP